MEKRNKGTVEISIKSPAISLSFFTLSFPQWVDTSGTGAEA